MPLIQKKKKNIECKETKNMQKRKEKGKNEACIDIEKEFNAYLGVTLHIAKQLRLFLRHSLRIFYGFN